VSGTSRNVRSAPRRRIRLRVVTNRGSSLTQNVSAGGFCTGMMRVPPPGTSLEGLIHVNGREAQFQGSVAWARPGNPRMSLLGAIGVRFTRIDPEVARRLESADEAPTATVP
jgi:PilZ domain